MLVQFIPKVKVGRMSVLCHINKRESPRKSKHHLRHGSHCAPEVPLTHQSCRWCLHGALYIFADVYFYFIFTCATCTTDDSLYQINVFVIGWQCFIIFKYMFVSYFSQVSENHPQGYVDGLGKYNFNFCNILVT